MHGCSKASLPASLETSLQATQDASGTSQAEGEERCTAFQQTPTSISLRGDQAPCGTGVHHAAAHRLSEHRLRRARVGSPWHREQSAHRPEGLDKHTHTCSLLAVETCQKGNSPLTGSTRDSAHRRNLSLSAHVQPALATALLILIFALGAPQTASAASLTDYTQCCAYFAPSDYNPYAINEKVKFWGNYSQHKCYEVPDSNAFSSPVPEASWWVSQDYVDTMCRNGNSFGAGARCDVNRTASCYSASNESLTYASRRFCQCSLGFADNGTASESMDGCLTQKETCIDVDECNPGQYPNVLAVSNDCDSMAQCVNTHGSFQCNCAAGSSQPDGWGGEPGVKCTACAPGKYKSEIGPEECHPCPANAISPSGAMALTECSCNAGYAGSSGGQCTACPPGTYKLLTGDYPCELCPVAKFNPSAGSSSCLACTGNATSHLGSTGISECTCLPGYTGTWALGCTACPAGSFKAANGSRACEFCEAGSYSEKAGSSLCTLCTDGAFGPTGSDSRYNCGCKAGFTPDPSSIMGALVCLPCQVGKFKSTNGTMPCEECSPGYYQPEEHSVRCQICPGAYYNPDSGGTSLDSCLPCSAEGDVFSFPGSVSDQDCSFGPEVLGILTSSECGSIQELPSSFSPSRNGHSLVKVGDRIYLFGGYFVFERNDVLYFDIVNRVWSEVLIGPGDPQPEARSEQSMVEIGGSLLIFGGRMGMERWNDLWEFKPQTDEWVELVANGNAGGPVGRYAHSSVAISGTMLMFGGQAASGNKLNDFWQWSSSGWTELTPSLRPSPRVGHKMVRSGLSLFLFGGKDASNNLLNDLWEYAEATAEWKRREPANAPSARSFHAMVGMGPVVLLHGGATSTNRLNDLWQYDTATDVWLQVFADKSTGLARRQLHQMVDLQGRLMIHGGAADILVGSEVQQHVAKDAWVFMPCICLLPGTTTIPGSYKCSQCGVATYKDWYGPGSCLACPLNATGPASSQSKSNCVCVPGFVGELGGECEACASGFYNLNGTQPCRACSAGTVSSGKASTSCTICPAGTFSEEDLGNGRAACVQCHRNSSSLAGSKVLTDCRCIPGYTGEGDCVPCFLGTYKSEYGPAECTLCTAGTYSTVVGSSSRLTCKTCPGRTGSDDGAEHCKCLAGFYPVSEVNAVCAPCQAGTFKADMGDFDCIDVCRPHEISLPGATSLDDCFCVKGYSREFGWCTECPPGTFKSFEGDSSCVPCAVGQYSDVRAATVCSQCPESFTSSPEGSSDVADCVCMPGHFLENDARCLPCVPGTFKVASGSEACAACAMGSYSQEAAQTSCNVCPLHSVAQQGSDSPEDCLCNPGYSRGPGQGCIECPAGTFKGTYGSAQCTTCETGKYSGPVSTLCTDCQHSKTTLAPRSTSPADCAHCKAGYSESQGSCTPCPPGSYKSLIGSSPCLQCAPGSYQGSEASVNCTLCESGSYTGESGATSRSSCTQCPQGKTTAPGGTTRADCRCNPGYTGPDGDGVCAACPIGTFKTQMGTAGCTRCPPGTYEAMTGSSSCTLCAQGKYLAETGSVLQSSCRDCPQNSNSPAGSALQENCLCISGYGITVDGRCEACLPGTFKNGSSAESCSDCPPGSFTFYDNVGYTMCSLCAEGKYSTKVGASSPTVCQDCPEFSSSIPGSSTCQCSKGYAVPDADILQSGYLCVACDPGLYKDVIGDHACSQCAVGYYSGSFGQTSCFACPEFSSTSNNQTNRAEGCECIAGYTGGANNSSPCLVCQPGTYKSIAGSSKCVDCEAAKYSNVVAATSQSVCSRCQDPFAWSPPRSTQNSDCVCDLGYYLPAGAIFCKECQKGKYKHEPGDNSSCVDCPIHSTTEGMQSSFLEECLCVEGYTGEPSNRLPCSPCGPGYYKHVLGTARCRACDFGKYLAKEGATSELECISCPDPNQWSRNASTSLSACRCAIGFTMIDYATSCSACQPGFYKPNPENMPCSRCDAGTYSFAAAELCTMCPTNSFSLAGSGLSTRCLCNKGFTGSNGGPCVACSPGTFKIVNGSIPCTLCGSGKYLPSSESVDEAQCVRCPNNTKSHAGSGAIDMCVCDPGYTGSGGSCAACPAGKFKIIQGSSACLNCEAGKYSGSVSATAAATCISCPANSVARPGSVAFQDCACIVGHTSNGVICTRCAPGSYKATNGSEACSLCTAGKYLGGTGARASTECRACPENSLSPEGSDTIADCVCAEGYTGNPELTGVTGDALNQACKPCALGTFKADQGSAACLSCQQGKYAEITGIIACRACPADSNSNAGSSRIAQCICNAGYSGSDGTCTACPPGTFKMSIGSALCTKCGLGKYSNVSGATTSNTCVACATGAEAPEGSDTAGDCVCNPGFTGVGQVCNACKAGTFKTAVGSTPCELCPSGKFSATTGAAQASICHLCPSNSNSFQGSSSPLNCTCNLGYSGSNGQPCLMCDAGKYKDWQGQGACASCPANAFAFAASLSLSDCKCNAGYTGADGSSCSACLPGSFKMSPGSAACSLCGAGKYLLTAGAVSVDTCVSCPPNTVSLSGSAVLQNCTCNAGYQRSAQGGCQACPVATYKDSAGEQQCQSCPAGATSAMGAMAVSACICDVGYSGSLCEACPAGTYKSIQGTSACVKCPARTFSSTLGGTSNGFCSLCPQHTTSTAGSNSQGNCTCQPGFITAGVGVCEVCPPGSYNNDGTAQSCNPCGAGLYSMEGSDNAADCKSYSFSVQGRMVLNGMNTVQDFLAKKALFVSSLADSINNVQSGLRSVELRSNQLVSVDSITVTKVCDSTTCYEIVKNGALGVSGPTVTAGQVEVEFEVRATTASRSGDLAATLGASSTLEGFTTRFFRSDATKSAAYSVTPAVVPSSAMAQTCGHWYELQKSGQVRSRHCMAQARGRFFSFGGRDGLGAYSNELRQFDVLTREWIGMISESSPAGPTPRIDATLVGSTDSLLLFGGRDESGSNLNDLWKLSMLTWTWKEVPQASIWPIARHLHSVAADDQGGFLMFGGKSKSARLNDLWRWDAVNQTWTELNNTDGPDGREGHAVAILASELFTFGGLNPANENANDFWKYSIVADTWERIFANGNANGPSGRHWHGMSAVNGSLLLYGGEIANSPLSDVWIYQPIETSWSQLQSNGYTNGPGQRSLFATAAVGSKVLVYGGRAMSSTYGDTWEYTVCNCQEGAERIGGFCNLCPAGTFKSLPGPQLCSKCPSAKYSAIIGATKDTDCLECPDHSWSPQGSTMTSQCSCRVGYSQQGSACTACVPGKFKVTNGTESCVECVKGSFAPDEASPICTFCPAGKYGSGLGSTLRTDESSSCMACPQNSSSLAGSEGPFDCLCDRGFMGRNGSTCTACSAGYYKDWNGEGDCKKCAAGKYSGTTSRDTDCLLCAAGTYSTLLGATNVSTCTSCPSLSDSSAGATLLEKCLCIAGSTGSNGICLACGAGKYKSINGSSECIDCPPGSYSTSTGLTSCARCVAGKYSTATSANSDVCVDCPSNTISEEGSRSVADCLCNAGFTGTNGVCTDCSPGTFKDNIGPAACTLCPSSTFSANYSAVNGIVCQPCPTRAESVSGSTDVKNCTCIAGSEKGAGGTCELCPAGKYKGPGGGLCINCPSGSWNVEGSMDVTACQCGQGYFFDGNACAMCEAGTYKTTNGSLACTDCNAGTYSSQDGARTQSACVLCAHNASSPIRSSSPASCLCNAGYVGDGVSVCAGCVAGTYKPSNGSSACSNCPSHSNSPVGSSSITACLCNAGYTSLGPSWCTACVAGTYKTSAGSISCTACAPGKYGGTNAAITPSGCLDCPKNSTSGPGSPSIFNCICLQGYVGANGAACSQCESGKYKPTNGSNACTLCSEGKFGLTPGAVSETSCSACRPNSYSAAGSNESAACFCILGYTMENLASECSKCPAGTYKAQFGDMACTTCPEDTYGEKLAASSISNCTNCPPNSRSPSGSDALTDCTCSQGYFLDSNQACRLCERGTYKDVSGNQACTNCVAGKYSSDRGATSIITCSDCPQFTSSLPGSEGSWQCLCITGYTGDLSECSACPPGTYKPTLGKDECTKCAAGKYTGLPAQSSEAACTNCLAGTTTVLTGRVSVTDCICNLGTTGGGGAQACQPCSPGSYKSTYGSGACTDCAIGKYSELLAQVAETTCQSCPSNSNTLQPKSSNLSQCLCDPGFMGDVANGITCSACPLGSFKEMPGTSQCEACLPGSYQHLIGKSSCSLCPAGKFLPKYGSNSSYDCRFCVQFTDSLPGSDVFTDCICDAGFTGPDGGPCTACTAGYFKGQNGSESCKQCQAGSWDNRDASTACVLCIPGKFSTAVGAIKNSTCIGCPYLTFSYLPGSDSVYDCLCIPGYTGPDGGNCTACDAGFEKEVQGNAPCSQCDLGTYSTLEGTSSCLECPAFSNTSSLQRTLLTECLCVPGYSGDISRGDHCSPCPAGTYKMLLGTSNCILCGHGKYSNVVAMNDEALCVSCPDPHHWSRLGSTDVLACMCNAGYFRQPAESVCSRCAAGKFKSEPGDGSCTDCRAGTYSDAVTAQSEETCQTCAQLQTSPRGSDERTDCACMAGYGQNGTGCSACVAGLFKNVIGNVACSPCALGSYVNLTAATVCFRCDADFTTTVSPGSTVEAECVCDLGFSKVGAYCQKCARGLYKDVVGDMSCSGCTNSSYSLPGAVSAQGCLCNQGYTGPDGVLCVACISGTFKPVNGSSTCTLCQAGKYFPGSAAVAESRCVNCPDNTNSEPGSSILDNCICNAGFTGPGGLCSACQPGTYKPTNGSSACTNCMGGKYSQAVAAISEGTCVPCTDHSNSPQGSDNLKDCACNAGYTGPDGNCSACPSGQYKPTNGSMDCILCSVAKYVGYTGAITESECIQCPRNSTSMLGRSVISDCLCSPGLTGDPATNTSCIACPSGSYKKITGSSACVACARGKYADFTGMPECTSCPSNSFSVLGSLSIRNCFCNAGYTGSAGVCGACPEGTFKNKTGPANCTLCKAGTYSNVTGQTNVSTCLKCPQNTSSEVGSGMLFDCLCSPGYSGNNTICTPCEVGKFKSIYGGSLCISCEAGKYAEKRALSACRTCHNNSHSQFESTMLADCRCNAGYTENWETLCETHSAISNGIFNGGLVDTTTCPQVVTCINCLPGTYKVVNGSMPCSLCDQGKYLNEYASISPEQCVSCPVNSGSSRGSKSLEDCVCDLGFTGASGTCSKCIIGTYKDTNGSSPCTLCGAAKYSRTEAGVSESVCIGCPEGKTSPEGSLESACVCDVGYSRQDMICQMCIQGKYKDQVGSQPCSDCPANASSAFGSDQNSDCYCMAGYYDSNSTGAMNCVACPVNHTSDPGQTNIDDCVCKAGYTGPGAGSCTACAAGFYKSVTGTSSCQQCANGKYADGTARTACSACPTHTVTSADGSDEVIDCVCAAGRTNFFGPDGVACSLCPANTYKTSIGSQNCTKCPFPSKSVPGSAEFNDCQCELGGSCFPCPTGSYRTWVGTVTSCIACEPGKYSSTVGATNPNDCVDCPFFSQSKAGAPSIRNCSCNVGFGGIFFTGSLLCSRCPIGFFKNWNGTQSCAECPSNSLTLQKQSDEIEDCLCNAGFTGRFDSCSACEPGTYKVILGTSACTDCSRGKYSGTSGSDSESVCVPCPPNAISTPGSWHILNCSCIPGFNGPNGGPCTPCPANTYKEIIGTSQCLSCPNHSVSNISSTRRVDCMCDLGYYGKNGTSCNICEHGKYKDAIGPTKCTLCVPAKYSPALGQISESACQDCSANATSDPGSWLLKQCLCLPGFWGKNGSTCTACSQATFKTPRGEAPVGLITDCNPCPVHSWSPFASPYCRCNVGYEGPDQGDYRDKGCTLCNVGKYKNWRGSGLCEACNERIKPDMNSFWKSPTNPSRACDWLCKSGYYYPDSSYLESDLHSFTRPVQVLEPAWFAWYELDPYKVTAPTQYYVDTRRYLPHKCELCATNPPDKNPCGHGEYWSATACALVPPENNGCKPCVNQLADGQQYVFPNVFWLLPTCPTTCDVGYYDNRADVLAQAGETSFWPTCSKCPAPRLKDDGSHVKDDCTTIGHIFYQCGAGQGYMGMFPEPLLSKVVNWNGQCQALVI